MAGFLKSSDLGPHPHGYGTSHHPHHAHPHGPLPPGMPMTSLAPFGLPHGLDAVGFPQVEIKCSAREAPLQGLPWTSSGSGLDPKSLSSKATLNGWLNNLPTTIWAQNSGSCGFR
ncbi:homeotic protein ocelliless-like protein [Anopheles sinensis]|uniref:Homeotic protein ocelliless-like protein n=1 Tax=Anopheles sinensis TaxID=74873 RepID=A0A084VGY5_ANOSI|nr:homeotic protein ocelliless-like protein [Anopheles sinensis]